MAASRCVVFAFVVSLIACGGGAPPAHPEDGISGVGECCGDRLHCPDQPCASSLHCGAPQVPVPVYVCCEVGKYCCTNDTDCQAYLPGLACDRATAQCRTSCATNDDSACAAGYHCETDHCVANVAAGLACDEASDCASGNCSADYASSGLLCAAPSSCANGAASVAAGYTLCNANVSSRRCAAAGTWSAVTSNPQPAIQTCDAGGGAASGFRPAATCSSGVDADAPGFHVAACQTCAPYRAGASGCLTSCGNNDSSLCWSGYHCAASAGNVCVSNQNGSACDNADPGDCASGRCDPDPSNGNALRCMTTLPQGQNCDESSDCTSGNCSGGVCAATVADGTACTTDAMCTSKNCSGNEFPWPNPSGSFCAPAATCWNTTTKTSYPVGYTYCIYANTSSTCAAEGSWSGGQVATGACSSGTSYGWLSVSCTSGTGSSAGVHSTCVLCPNGFVSNSSYNGCLTTCTSDVHCAPAFYCNGSSTCSADVANGTSCTKDAMCRSGRCDGTCMDKLPDSSTCDEDSDCTSGDCYLNRCHTTSIGSCPFVFAWNGGDFEYQSDLQGPAIGPARFASRIHLYGPDYLVMPTLVPDYRGDVLVKIREPLPEVDYIDEVKLLAFDVPDGYEVMSSSAEDTYRMGFVAPFQLYTARDPVPPLAATDQSGADILSYVRELDDVPAPAQGVDEPVYTFDFGPIAHPENAKLVIDGWAVIGPAYGSTTSLTSYVEVVDEAGQWVRARTFGFPAGDMKRMSISLAGLFRSSDQRVRLHLGRASNSRWVLDRIRLDTSPAVPVTQVAEVSAALADLTEHGSLTYVWPAWTHRLHAVDDALPPDPQRFAFGNFTQLGDVSGLLGRNDDEYVVMRHGDQLEMVFPGPLPPAAPGTRRVYVLKVSLFYKTLDLSSSVDPMPFHAMSDYPYPATESFPSDPEHALYLSDWNTRYYAP